MILTLIHLKGKNKTFEGIMTSESIPPFLSKEVQMKAINIKVNFKEREKDREKRTEI